MVQVYHIAQYNSYIVSVKQLDKMFYQNVSPIYLALLASVFIYSIGYGKQQAVHMHNLVPKNIKNRSGVNYELTQPRCGQWHNTLTGSIFYKPFEQVEDNERCVWILGVAGAVGYTVNLQYLGEPSNQPGSGQQLILSGIFHTQAEYPLFQNHIP